MTTSFLCSLKLVKPNVLTICTIDNFIPIIYRDQRNNWQGFEVDILQSFAKKFGLKLEFNIAPFDGIWHLPKQGKCDIAAAGISISKKRCNEGAAFTEPYLFIKQSLLVKKANREELETLTDTKGKTLGIVPGTTGASYAQDHAPSGTQFAEFTDENTMLKALQHDKIDAVARGNPGNAYQAKQHKEYTLTGLEETDEKFALVVSDDNEFLLQQLNQHIQSLKNSGELEKLYKKWC